MCCKDGCKCKWCKEEFDVEGKLTFIDDLLAKNKALRDEVRALEGDTHALLWRETRTELQVGTLGTLVAQPADERRTMIMISPVDQYEAIINLCRDNLPMDRSIVITVTVHVGSGRQHCTACEGSKVHGDQPCAWCYGTGVSVLDEAQRVATALYGAWLRGWL